jgi:uncharacterized protein YjbI with pentapeptide repeats/nucleoside phosphorylase
MAPERPGMLSVLDLSYKNGDLESRTETYRVETNEMLTESAGKLRVDWRAIEAPQGGEYFPVGDGVAYVNDDDAPLIHPPKKETEDLSRTGPNSYEYTDWVPEKLWWLMVILILPRDHTCSRIEPEPMRLRAKTFEDRLVLLVWAKAIKANEEPTHEDEEPTHEVQIQLEIEALEDGLESEVMRINDGAIFAQPVTPQFTIPDVDVVEPLSSNLDVGIVIALTEEFSNLFSQIDTTAIDNEEINRTFFQFERSGYRCVATFMGEMGATDAALASSDLMHLFNPTTIVSIGIAGSLDKDVKVGDAIVAENAIDFIRAAKAIDAIENGGDFDLELAPDSYRATPKYTRLAKNLAFAYSQANEEWLTRARHNCENLVEDTKREELVRKGLIEKQPKLHTGSIATSPWVVATQRSVEWLRRRVDRKCLAVEMEATGVMKVASHRSASTLIIKGVSDYSDERKSELDRTGGGALRRSAMSHAVALLWPLMDDNLIQRSVTEKPRDSSIPISPSIETRQQEKHDTNNERRINEHMDYLLDLLSNKQLREQKRYNEVRVVARNRTLQAFQKLDKDGKRDLLQFLFEAALIQKEDPDGKYEYPVIGLSDADLSNANLRGITLENSALNGAILEKADIRDSKLKGIDLGGAFLSGADFEGADLRGADFASASLEPKRNPEGEKLKGANLSRANLEDAMLSRANLRNVSLRDANLVRAFLEQNHDRALREADLSGADLTGATLAEAKVTDEQLDVCKSLKGATMPNGSKHE